MTDQPIIYAQDGAVARVTLNRPEKRNAFDDALVAALDDALAVVEADPSVRLLVLNGAGDHFCAGADLNWMRRMADRDEAENRADARAFADMLARLDRLPVPTLAIVHGAVFGGGVGLVCLCDIAICDLSARFSLSEVRLGLVPAVIGPYVLRAIGQRWARRLMLTAEVVPADMARAIGFVHEVAVDPEARAGDFIAQLLAAAPKAQAEAKALLRRCAAAPIDEALIADTAALIARLRAGDEAREGIGAFLAGRPPDWPAR